MYEILYLSSRRCKLPAFFFFCKLFSNKNIHLEYQIQANWIKAPYLHFQKHWVYKKYENALNKNVKLKKKNRIYVSAAIKKEYETQERNYILEKYHEMAVPKWKLQKLSRRSIPSMIYQRW